MPRNARIGTSHVTGQLQPIALAPPGVPQWEGATWVGQISTVELDGTSLELAGGQDFQQARLLVWDDDQPRGSVEVPVADGLIDLAVVALEMAKLPELPPLHVSADWPPISIVICTRDRPEHLANVLRSLYGLDYPLFEVVVVDNNPTSGQTPPVVSSFDGLPLRIVSAAGQGLSIARNVGVQNARFGIVAFTDDDVVIDRRWLTNIANGFSRDERVACVCGMVPTSELFTPAQAYFDQRVGWAERWRPAVYDLEDQVGEDSLFPLRVSEFGTGANFAVRKSVVVALGGFDEGLGAGAPTGSGEDVDMFVRILLDGLLLVREPAAVVWHSHRKTLPELESQMYGYGLGLSAWLLKLLIHPRTCWMVARRLLTGLRHLRQVTIVDHAAALEAEPGLSQVDRREMAAVIRGPWALLRGRLAGRRPEPLRAPRGLGRMVDFRRGQMWEEGDSSLVAGRLVVTAIVLSLIGSLGAVQSLPAGVRAVAIGIFILGGPGSLATSFYAKMPRYALAALTPVLGLAICIVTVTGLLMAGVYRPEMTLLALTLASAVGGLLRCGYLVSVKRVAA
jgi:GT2 family glycosyltransferase